MLLCERKSNKNNLQNTGDEKNTFVNETYTEKWDDYNDDDYEQKKT